MCAILREKRHFNYKVPRVQRFTLAEIVALPGEYGSSRVITFIGGGGKTSLMYLLARCLQEKGFAVVTTTTTKLYNEQRPGISFARPASLEDAKAKLEQAQLMNMILTMTGEVLPAEGKLSGVPSDWVDQLSREYPATIFLVEGDGSAGRSLKAHLPHEPVIPACTSLLVPVIGLDVLGKPLNEENVHRAEIFAKITGSKPGDPIGPAEVMAALLHEEGYLKLASKTATVMPLLNKAESRPSWKAGRNLAQKLLSAGNPQIKSVLVGSVQQNCFVRFS